MVAVDALVSVWDGRIDGYLSTGAASEPDGIDNDVELDAYDDVAVGSGSVGLLVAIVFGADAGEAGVESPPVPLGRSAEFADGVASPPVQPKADAIPVAATSSSTSTKTNRRRDIGCYSFRKGGPALTAVLP